jgi:hypothetical protein
MAITTSCHHFKFSLTLPLSPCLPASAGEREGVREISWKKLEKNSQIFNLRITCHKTLNCGFFNLQS